MSGNQLDVKPSGYGSELRAPTHAGPPSLQQELRNRSLFLSGLIQQMCQKAQNHLQNQSRQMAKHLRARVQGLDQEETCLRLSCYPSSTHSFILISMCLLPKLDRSLAQLACH